MCKELEAEKLFSKYGFINVLLAGDLGEPSESGDPNHFLFLLLIIQLFFLLFLLLFIFSLFVILLLVLFLVVDLLPGSTNPGCDSA